MREAGSSYRDIEAQGYGLVVVESRAFYRKSLHFDDELTVRTELAELKRASLRFDYTLLRGDETVATGYTWHGFVDLASGKPRRIPKSLIDRLYLD